MVQLHTWGMELLRSDIVEVLAEVIDPRGIYERSDVGTRRADGLKDRRSGHLRGEQPPPLIEIREGAARLFVDVRRGQKTGFFLDQRDNRMLLGRYAASRSTLDCFGYTGSFAAHAAKGGARAVVSVDIARDAAALAARNIEANRGDSPRHCQVVADLFPMLEQLSERGPRFDVVVLDPPALVRRSRDVKTATGVYIKLNRNAIKLVADGGYLLTSSCSTPHIAGGVLPGRAPRRGRGAGGGQGPGLQPAPPGPPGRPRLSGGALPQDDPAAALSLKGETAPVLSADALLRRGTAATRQAEHLRQPPDCPAAIRVDMT